MLRDKTLKAVAFASLLALSLQAKATPGNLEIKVDKNSDLTKESTLTDLKTEARVTTERERHADQVAISASFLSLGHPTISTDQVSRYNLSSGTAVGFEYSHSFQNPYRITATAGYEYVQQSSSLTPTALHVIPIGVMGEYVWKNWENVRPFVGAGVLNVIQSQRGVDAENLTENNTMPVLTLGADFKVVGNVKLHARVRELLPLSNGGSEFYGQIYDLGIVTSL